MGNSGILIKTKIVRLSHPVTNSIVQEATQILNKVFNLAEFEEELSRQSFVCTNRPEFCRNGKEIAGVDVFSDFISKESIEVLVSVKILRNWWKRYVSKTMGETNPNGNSIITYNWWLKNDRNLAVNYAIHLGHEIFHTRYFGYIHDPEINDKDFVNEKDVTYMIDDILERLIKKYNPMESRTHLKKRGETEKPDE